jgi:hypothetical protein
MMRRYPMIAALGVVLLSIAVLAPNALAQNNLPSTKATAAVNTAVGCTVSNATSADIGAAPMTCKDVWTGNPVAVTADNFVTIMSVPMKVSNSQSLFASPSLVTGLYTNTSVKTKPGSTSTATAAGGVYMRAVLSSDAAGLKILQVADPVGMCTNDILGCAQLNGSYGVVLDSRVQTLSQTLSDCVVNVMVGSVAGSGTCTFDSTIDLILKTTSAHSYNFIFPNVGQGVYYIVIQLGVDSGATVSGSGTAVGSAAFGLGSLTVESVRLVHNFSF